MTPLCHICLLPIPPNIVMPKHPLFGTKDHVVPRSKGGTNDASNLAPAHYYCNQEKGVKEVTPQMMLYCTRVINRELQAAKYEVVNPKLNQFRQQQGRGIDVAAAESRSQEAVPLIPCAGKDALLQAMRSCLPAYGGARIANPQCDAMESVAPRPGYGGRERVHVF